MANITLSVPEELKQRMEKMPEIRWSEVARNSIESYISKIERVKELTKGSKLTEEDALEIGKKINKSAWERYKKNEGGG